MVPSHLLSHDPPAIIYTNPQFCGLMMGKILSKLAQNTRPVDPTQSSHTMHVTTYSKDWIKLRISSLRI